MNLINKKINQLKKYSKPVVEVNNFKTEDVIMASGEETYVGCKNSYEKERKWKEEQSLKFKAKEKSAILKEENFEPILEDTIKNFFPATGIWYSNCFDRKRDIKRSYLPCHLRNNRWLSELLYKEIIEEQGVKIPKEKILNYISKSEEFQNLRHNYELEIVKWQINWIKGGGENWSIPEGFEDGDESISEDCDVCFREAVIATLTEIGMNAEVIEEGLEKNADIWRNFYFKRAFRNAFEPIGYLRKTTLKPATESHKQNWLDNREYEYYLQHRESVERYGVVTENMKMSDKDYFNLQLTLKKQNEKRLAEIEEWKNIKNDYIDILR